MINHWNLFCNMCQLDHAILSEIEWIVAEMCNKMESLLLDVIWFVFIDKWGGVGGRGGGGNAWWDTLIRTADDRVAPFPKVVAGRVFFWFVLGLTFRSRIFHSYGDVTITCKDQILTFTRHSWPLHSEGSLAFCTFWDTGHPFIMVISEDSWHSHFLLSVKQWSCHYLFLRLTVPSLNLRQNPRWRR